MPGFKNLSLRAKILWVGGTLILALCAVLFILYAIKSRDESVLTFEEKARAINLMAESARQGMDEKFKLGIVNVPMLKQWLVEGKKNLILEVVPVVTAWKAAMAKARDADYTFKVPKFSPRNPQNTPDELEAQALNRMKTEGVDEISLVDKGTNTVRSFRAVRLTETCLLCHGDPATSKELWDNDKGLDPFGTRMEGWKVGEIHGAFEVIQSLGPADRALRTSLYLGGGVVVVGLVLIGVLFVFIIQMAVNRPIKIVTENLEEASSEIAAAANEVAKSSQSLAEGASSQAASLEEVSASLKALSDMTRSNADNATKANELMNETRDIVQRTGISMDQMNSSMSEISESGQKISRIIGTIDEIAFQTNLLALNASVEAARAGEAGLGFAVVADEVRNLAGRAAEAAKNTAGLIDGTVKKIAQGSQLVQESQSAFNQVNEVSQKVGALVGEVASASSQQAVDIDQIHQAMATMDGAIQANAAQSEEAAAASEELGSQSDALLVIVEDLEGVVKGK